jgi:hypothetical protein
MHRSDDTEGDGRPETPEERARREATELMAGFDRPGRTPRRAGGRDFVDHFGGASPERAHSAGPSRRARSTFSLPDLPIARLPGWVPWLLLGVGIAFGVTALAWVVTADDAPTPPRSPSVPKPGPEGAAVRKAP